MQKTSLLSSEQQSKKNIIFIIGIIFVAFNLRPSITAVGPLIRYIKDDIGLSNTEAGLLTTLPLVVFALLSPLAPKVSHSIGKEMTVFIALVLLSLGILIRSVGLVITLFVGTAFLGLGIAFCNVLLPGIVKNRFPAKIGLMTGMYTVAMSICAGLAPGISVPFANHFAMGWQGSLGVWGILAVISLIVWAPQMKKRNIDTNKNNQREPNQASLLKSPIAWQITIFMGLQSFIYFCFITWLPEMLQHHSINITTAGWMVSIVQFSGIPANFIIPIIADRMPNQRPLVLGIGAICSIGILGLLLGTNIGLLTWSIFCIGVGTGAALSLALTLMGLRAANSEQASNLSGMAQSIGYLLAALGPLALGFIFDVTQSWTIPLLLLLVVTLIMTGAGIGAGRNQYVLPVEAEQKQMSN